MTQVGRGLVRWLFGRALRLRGLRLRERRLAGVGLVAAAVSGLLIVALYAAPQPELVCSGPARVGGGVLLTRMLVDTVALLVIGGGLALVEVAGSAARWRFPRLRLGLLAVIPTAVATLALLGRPALRSPLQPFDQLIVVAGPVIALGLLAFALGIRIIRPHLSPRSARALPGPLVAVVVAAGWVGVFSGDPCPMVLYLHRLVGMLGTVAMVAAVAMVMWLAFEELRLSGQVGVWFLRRASPVRVANVALLIKLLVVLAVVLAAVAGRPGAVAAQFAGLGREFVAAIPVVILILVLFAAENRLVRSGPDRFPELARILGFAAFAWLVPVLILIPLPLIDLVLVRWPTALLAVATAGLAILFGLALRRRRRPLRRGALAAAVIILTSGWVWATTMAPPPGAVAVGLTTSPEAFVVILAVSGLIVLLALVVLSHTSRLREFRTYVYVAIAWLILVELVPGLLLRSPVRLVVIDLAVLGAAVIAFLLRRFAGWRHGISDREIVLLLILTTVLIELPIVLDALPPLLTSLLLLGAVLGPGLTSIVVDAGPLNHGSGRAVRVLATIGVLCLAYGLVLTIASEAVGMLSAIDQVTAALLRSFTLPLTVVLAAAYGRWLENEPVAVPPALG